MRSVTEEPPLDRYGSMGLQVWFHGATGMVPWGYRYGSMGLQVWFHGATGMVPWGYRYGSMGLQVWKGSIET